MSTKPEAPGAKAYFETIATFLRKHVDAAPIVANHVAAKHRIHSLAAFHVSPAIGQAEKLETYKEIAIALPKWKRGEPHGLLGAKASGQAEAPEPDKPDAEEELALPSPTPEPEAEKKPEPPAPRRPSAAQPRRTPPAPADDPLTAKLREILIALIGDMPASIDEDRIRQLAAAEADTRDAEHAGQLRKEIAEMGAALEKTLGEAAKHAAAPRAVELKIGERTGRVDGVAHRQLMQVVTWLAADVPVWLWGQAGGGKTTLGEQAAQLLGLPFYCVSIDETITVGKLVGFKNLATGDHVEGLLYRPYKEGGLVLLDEIDTNATTIASLNAMLANEHYTFGNGERVARHKDFRVLAGANTCGMGAVAGYTARVRLDAATLDRFAVLRLEYDWDMVGAIACGLRIECEPWHPEMPAPPETCRAYFEWVRRVSSNVGASVLVSPRAALLGVRALRAGVPMQEVVDALVFRFCTADTRQRIVLEAGPVPQKARPVSNAA